VPETRVHAQRVVPPGYRPEIQALRAVSVMLVVLFHLWPNQLRGGYVGVDIFFVISGYLITSHLLRESASTGTIKLSQFYARRLRRLLPAALVVLVTTLVAVVLFVPKSLWELFVTEIMASAVSVQNWVLAFNAVDYFAEDNAASPVQHYWSLSVEEQFYLVWPLMILAVLVATRAARPETRRRVLVAVFGAVFAASLVYSIIATAEAQQFAYFATPAHAWEFAAGGLLALAPLGRLARRPRLSGIASWGGFALIIGSALLFTGETAFPGYIALIPVAGAILVIAAGSTQSALSPRRLVEWRPVQFVGDISYSLYLWHWAPIVILPFVLDRELSSVDKVAILIAALALAVVTKRFVEDPVRRSKPLMPRRLTYSLAAVLTLALVAGSVTPIAILDSNKRGAVDFLTSHGQTSAMTTATCFGAAAMDTPAECELSHTLTPFLGPEFATRSAAVTSLRPLGFKSPSYSFECTHVADSSVTTCDSGVTNPTETIVLVGDSHANHLLSPLLALADELDWRIIRLMETSCRPAIGYTSNVPAELTERCQNWKGDVVDYVASLPSSYIVVTSGATQGYHLLPDAPSTGAIADGFLNVWNEWLGTGHRVVAISDVPAYPTTSVPTCIDASHAVDDPCARPRGDAIVDDPILVAAATVSDDRFAAVDLYPHFCDETQCHAIVGGIITLKDTNHMTGTFSETLSPYIYDAIASLPAA